MDSPSDLPPFFGRRLKRLRRELGISQEQLAELVGVTPETVSRWERSRNAPTISVRQVLADALAVEARDLFGASAFNPLSAERVRRIAHTYGLEQELLDPRKGRWFLESGLRLSVEAANVSVTIFDVDKLTQINARHGLEVGDRVLCTVGAILTEATCAPQRWMRCGDDTFFVMAPGQELPDAQVMAKAVLDRVRHYPWEELSSSLYVTVSAGCASWRAGSPAQERKHRSEFREYYYSCGAVARRAGTGFQTAKSLGGNAVALGPVQRQPARDESGSTAGVWS